MFTKLPRILLKEEDNKQYWFYTLREDQAIGLKRDINSTPKNGYGINILRQKYGIDISTISMHGDIKVDENTAKRLVDFTFIEDKLNKIKTYSYKCFCCGNLILDTIITHKTAIDSWKCMLTKMCDPKFGAIVIINKRINGTSKED